MDNIDDLLDETPESELIPLSGVPGIRCDCPACGQTWIETRERISADQVITTQAGTPTAIETDGQVSRQVISFRCLNPACGKTYTVERDEVLALQMAYQELLTKQAQQQQTVEFVFPDSLTGFVQ